MSPRPEKQPVTQNYKELVQKSHDRLIKQRDGKKSTLEGGYEESQIKLNKNQQKSYNARYEFFTKPLGPGHYEPLNHATKPNR